MAGGIFQPVLTLPPDGDLTSDSILQSQSPLVCYLCKQNYESPCLLDCFHSFCGRCLSGRSTDGQMSCPLCGEMTKLEDGKSLPPSDKLLEFLLRASSLEKALCANCDQMNEEMFYCNTCAQPLCTHCRRETHRAKMFSSHVLVPLSQRLRPEDKTCGIHGQPYIMFSMETNKPSCINCFHSMNFDARALCIDLDSAYTDGCKQLSQAVLVMKELQQRVEEDVKSLQNLLIDIKMNAESERVAILTFCADMQEKLAAKRDDLIKEVERQYKCKERQFCTQLTSLSSILPTLYLHLLSSTAFTDTANKYEFLQLGYDLVQRLMRIAESGNPVPNMPCSKIDTDYRHQFARSVEALLNLRSLHSQGNRNELPVSAGSNTNTSGTITFTSDGGRKINGSGNKVILIEGHGEFASHFKDLESKHREVVQKFEATKKNVQELQRDLTHRQCLANLKDVNSVLDQCKQLQLDLTSHLEGSEKQRPILERNWKLMFEKVANEQEVFQAQINDILRMQNESCHLKVISEHFVPFINSINLVTEIISPVLCTSQQLTQQEDCLQSMMDQINTLEPDSQHRVERIREVEEDRQFQIAHKTNPMDDELVRTKGMLKSPTQRKETNPFESSKNKATPSSDVPKSETKLEHSSPKAEMSKVVIGEKNLKSTGPDLLENINKCYEEEDGNNSCSDYSKISQISENELFINVMKNSKKDLSASCDNIHVSSMLPHGSRQRLLKSTKNITVSPPELNAVQRISKPDVSIVNGIPRKNVARKYSMDSKRQLVDQSVLRELLNDAIIQRGQKNRKTGHDTL